MPFNNVILSMEWCGVMTLEELCFEVALQIEVALAT